jgi:hypothetical protein
LRVGGCAARDQQWPSLTRIEALGRGGSLTVVARQAGIK